MIWVNDDRHFLVYKFFFILFYFRFFVLYKLDILNQAELSLLTMYQIYSPKHELGYLMSNFWKESISKFSHICKNEAALLCMNIRVVFSV